MSLDPEILKRTLPANIHATVDQVTENVNAAVDDIINRFVKDAQAGIDKIEKGDFTDEITKALAQAKLDLNADFASMAARFKAVDDAVAEANKLAADATQSAAALASQLAAVNQAATALKTDLSSFRAKLDTFATKSGSMIASAALKAVGV